MSFNVLVLGGTLEGRLLGERLGGDARYAILLSFAGRTESLKRPQVPHRIGGFGGVEGLARTLRERPFDALIDATHPFAARISSNAVQAAALTGTPLLRLGRPSWEPMPGDHWVEVSDFASAARAIGDTPRRVLLTVGRQEVSAFEAAPQHDYLIRAVDHFDPDLPRARVLAARGPFARAAELALLTRERIDCIVSKNSGTPATYAKIEAARALRLPVIMVQRPSVPAAREAATLDDVCAWLAALHDAPSSRRRE